MENVVTKGAAPAEPMHKLTGATPGQTGGWEDLGGPTPENYKPDDESATLKTPGATLAQVKDVVNAKAAAAMPMQGVKEETEDEDEILEETDEDEVVSEAADEDKEEETPKKGKKKEDEEDEEEEDEMKEEFDIEEDVNALLNTGDEEELSEEFKEKAKVVFESALRSKVSEIKEELEVQYEQRLIEEVDAIKASLEERIDSYLEYVSEEWISENELAIEHGLKTEMTESFLQGMRGLFEEHYVSIPEDKYDVLESMVEKLDDMETKLNEQIEKNIHLNNRLAESVANGIFDEISEGLALSQKEKLASLAESVEFEGDAEYREKLETLKESYFPSRSTSPQAKTETLSEGVDVATEYHSDSMNAYLRTLSAVAKK
jgi:hypothetical protein